MEYPSINKVGAVFVHVTDLARSAAWYSKLLGQPLGPIEPESPIYCPTMATEPGLILDDNRYNIGTERDVRPAFAFETPDCAATLAQFKKRGVKILYEVIHEGRPFLFTFADPFGNNLMVMEEHGDSPASAPSSPIQNRITEVSLRVSDREAAVRWYAPLLGVPCQQEDALSMHGDAALSFMMATDLPVPSLTLATTKIEEALSLVEAQVLYSAPGWLVIADPDGTPIGIRQV